MRPSPFSRKFQNADLNMFCGKLPRGNWAQLNLSGGEFALHMRPSLIGVS